jgi:hypothetical protein
MRNYKKTIGAIAAITALSAGVASAEVEGEVIAGYASSYNFRGVELGENLAEAGVNLSMACPVTQGEFSVGVWYGSTNDDQSLVTDQLQTSIGWSRDLGFAELGVGFINYDFKGDPVQGVSNFDTSEFCLSLSKELYEGIRGSVAAFYDIDLADGWYFEGALSKSFDITACAKLDLSAGLSVYQSYSSPALASLATDGVNHWFVSAALPIQVRDNLVITPNIRYVDVTSDNLSGGPTLATGDDEFIGGIRASVSF